MLKDESMILKIGNYKRPDFIAKEVYYHQEGQRNAYIMKRNPVIIRILYWKDFLVT